MFVVIRKPHSTQASFAKKLLSKTGWVSLATLLMAGSAFAQPAPGAGESHARPGGVQVGVLTCNESSGWEFIFGSSHAIRCALSTGDRVYRYTGAISKFGIDVGYQGAGVLVWGVFSPTTSLGRGDLNGRYGGLTAGAAAGVGASANLLVGGSHRSITLQPLSIEGATGLNVAAGVGELTLREAPRRQAAAQ
jgi:hypothetical protein